MSRARDLVLVGPPGAGKSVVGRRLADRLGRAFVDLDEMIAGAAGASIPTIFATEGELPDENGTLPTGVVTTPVRTSRDGHQGRLA